MKQHKRNNSLKVYLNYFSNNTIEIVILSISISIVYSLFSSNLLVVFIIFLILASLFFLNEKTLVLLSIIILISFIGESFQEYRDYFTIISFSLLSFFFLKKFGTNFKSFPKPPTIFTILIFILILSITLSTSLTGFNNESIFAVFRASIFLLICYFFYAFLEEKISLRNVYVLISGIFASSLILSLTVYYDLFRSGFLLFIFDVLITRWGGAIGNPNTLALIVSMNIILLIVLLFSKKISKKIKISVVPFLLLNNTIILILTNSRAAILGLFVSLLFLFYYLKRKILIYFFVSLIILALLYFFEPFIQSLFDLYLRLETISQRHYLWQAGVEIIQDYPILGVGPEVYPAKFYSYLPTSASYFFNLYLIIQKPHPHNFILWFVAEMGILGWISSLSIFGFYFFMAGRLIYFRKKLNDELYLFSIGLFAIGILVFVRSFFEVEGIFSYGYISRDLPFWVAYIILAFIYKNQNKILMIKK